MSAGIGTAKIKVPVIQNPLEGAVHLASPAPAGELGQNPFDSLIGLYVVVHDPTTGVLVKIAGEFLPDSLHGLVDGGVR